MRKGHGFGVECAFNGHSVIKVKFPDIVRAGSLGLVLLNGTLGAGAAVEILPDGATPAVFGSGQRVIRTHFHNPTVQPAEANLSFRLYQTSRSTMMPLGETRPWK